MSEVHLSPVPSTGVVFHSPGQHPLPVSAGKSVTTTAKVPGQPNSAAHGQVNSASAVPGPVFDNPA
jgi:hypothetical protein